MQINDQTAREWYEKNRDNPEASGFSVPDIIRARHIFISTVEEDSETQKLLIDDIHLQLTRDKKDFAELANTHSEDERSKLLGGDLGWFSRRRMPEDFIKKVFPLAKGTISAPFRTNLGWHIVEITDKKESRALSYEELKPEVIAWLKNQRSKEVLQIFLLKLRKASNIMVYPENI